jgi:hypothetical protein
MSPVKRVFNFETLFEYAKARRSNGYKFGDAIADTLAHEFMDLLKTIKQMRDDGAMTDEDWDRFKIQFREYFDTIMDLLE